MLPVTWASTNIGVPARHARSNAARNDASSPAVATATPAAPARRHVGRAGVVQRDGEDRRAEPRRVRHSPAIAAKPAAAPTATTRASSWASAAASAAGSAKRAVATPLAPALRARDRRPRRRQRNVERQRVPAGVMSARFDHAAAREPPPAGSAA